MTVQDFVKEHNRIQKLLKIKIVTSDAYKKHCREGLTPHMYRKYLGKTFNQLKAENGLPVSSTGHNKGGAKKSEKKITCLRTSFTIAANECVPYCNDICHICPDIQKKNIAASEDTLSHEEEIELRESGHYGSNMVMTFEEDGACIGYQ